MVEEEARIVVERQHAEAATNAALFQMALSTVPNERLEISFTKEATARFAATIKDLSGG